MMPVADTGLETCSISGTQHGRTAVLDQRDLALEHVDELVLLLVPVAQRRGRAGPQPREVDPELREPRDVAERRLLAPLGDAAPGLGIHPLGAHGCLGDVDLGHIHTRSTIVAVPMPAPMQSVTSAVERSRRSSSSMTVPRIMAPVAPSGWPMAMAPPLTLTLAGSRSKAC